jgi:hypothetical protein
MKITKQRLKEIIKEEVEFMGPAIDDIPEPPEEEPTRDRAFDSSLGRYATLMNAREKLNQMSDEDLKAFAKSLPADMFATLLHILGPKYTPIKEETVELAEQRRTLPPMAPEYASQLRTLISKYGREAVAQEYENVGGTFNDPDTGRPGTLADMSSLKDYLRRHSAKN